MKKVPSREHSSSYVHPYVPFSVEQTHTQTHTVRFGTKTNTDKKVTKAEKRRQSRVEFYSRDVRTVPVSPVHFKSDV